MLLLYLAAVQVVMAGQMSICEFFRKLRVDSPECRPPPDSVYGSFHRLETNRDDIDFNSIVPLNAYAGLPLCSNYFHSCMPSTDCESGVVCASGGGSCCTNPSQKTCPSPTSLNIQCRKLRAVNWCSSDYDCRGLSTMSSICCPTGCNYNMCVNPGFSHYSIRRRRQSVESDECPDPYSIPLRCPSRRPTNWCLTDSECPSVNTVHPRKCCLTVCGYNACLVKYNGKWTLG